MRIGCLFVPQMPLAALFRAEPDLQGAPVAIYDGEGSRRRVVACSREAQAAGITPGITVAGALGFLPDIVLRPFSGAQVRSTQAALLDVARSFSPRVALDDGGEVCLDLSGLRHLFPSDRKLGSALLVNAEKTGLEARAGIASTRFCALLAARTTDGLHVVPAGEERTFLAPLPVNLLEASADLHAALCRFGIERLGQLAELSPKELGRRLGPGGLRLWRLARGEDFTPLVPVPAPERFVEETECSHPVERVEPLLFILQGVLERLSQRLRARGLATRGLSLTYGLDPVGIDERSLILASPTPEAHTWLPVVKLSLEENPPRASVISVSAEAKAEPARRAQLNLFTTTGPAPGKLDDILVRLAALCGEARIGSPRTVDSHRPEAFALVPFGTRAGIGSTATPAAEAPALRAIRPPEKVEVLLSGSRPMQLHGGRIRGRVIQVAGPWRLEGAWWEKECLIRDYYEVEISNGEIYRIYQDRNARKWFVDGICG